MHSFINMGMQPEEKKRLEEYEKKIITKELKKEEKKYGRKENETKYCTSIDPPLGLFQVKTEDIPSKLKN